MRSSAGVGMTPPKVLGEPKPSSSVMISSTLGEPFGGTTRGGHHGVDSEALSLITPPNFGSGGGSWLPLSVVVALGEPSVPVTSTAWEILAANIAAAASIPIRSLFILVFMNSTLIGRKYCLGVEDAGQLVRRPVYITKTTLRCDLLRRALQVGEASACRLQRWPPIMPIQRGQTIEPFAYPT